MALPDGQDLQRVVEAAGASAGETAPSAGGEFRKPGAGIHGPGGRRGLGNNRGRWLGLRVLAPAGERRGAPYIRQPTIAANDLS